MNNDNLKPDDQSLINDFKSGDHKVFSYIITKYQASVIRICRGYTGSYEDAEDLAQEVFIELFRSAERFRGDASLSTWIYRIAVSRAINFVRDNRNRYRIYRSADSAGERVLENSQSELTSEGELVSADHRKALRFAIDKLAPNQKKVFILNKFEDLSYKEIANILEISHSSVESLIFRAKQNLQKSLAAYYKKNMT
jgi:RNA polymerase sigma-70 factor, ECF subfamily